MMVGEDLRGLPSVSFELPSLDENEVVDDECIENDAINHDSGNKSGGNLLQCHMCGKRFNWTKELNSHLADHLAEELGGKVFQCPLFDCTFKGNTRSDLHEHQRQSGHGVKENKPYGCQYCTYSCSQKSSMIIHMRVHTGERPYKCNLCPYRATQRSSLTRHQRVHMGNKPFKCDFCSYRATSACGIQSHMVHKHSDTVST